MSNVMFSSEQITAFIVVLTLCVLVPVFLFVRYYMTKKPRLSSFFIGCLGAILLVGGKYLFDMIFIMLLDLGGYINPSVHPVWTAIYVAAESSILMTLITWLLLRYGMEGRQGRENAFFMLIGKGAVYVIAYGATSAATYLSVALTVNQGGLDAYLKSITDASARSTQQTAITALAARPVAEIVSEGLLFLVVMVIQLAAGVLIYMAMHKTKDILTKEKLAYIRKKEKQDLAWYEKRTGGLIPLAVILQFLVILPLTVLQVGLAQDYAIILLIADCLLTLAAGFACYTVFKQLN